MDLDRPRRGDAADEKAPIQNVKGRIGEEKFEGSHKGSRKWFRIPRGFFLGGFEHDPDDEGHEAAGHGGGDDTPRQEK